MADSMTKEELRKEITGILKGADLATTSSKKVRQELETKLEVDLSSRKKEIDEIVMQCIKESDKKGKKPKKNGNKNDDDEDEDDKDEEEDDKEEEEDEEEEEEDDVDVKKSKRGAPKKANKRKASSDESDDASEDKGSDEEYSPTKKAKGMKAGKKSGSKGRKKKGGSDSDSDEDWGKGKKGGNAPKKGGPKRGGGGYNKTCTLTPELAAVVGQDSMARHEVVKKVWSIIKEKNLYDPKNKQFAICNDDLMKVIGVKRFRTFGMMKYLKKHFVD